MRFPLQLPRSCNLSCARDRLLQTPFFLADGASNWESGAEQPERTDLGQLFHSGGHRSC